MGSMQLHADSDAAYLVKPGAKSRYAGHFYLVLHPNILNYNKVPNNTPILTKYNTLKNIVCSAGETEIGWTVPQQPNSNGNKKYLT
eukprot:5573850-Ditylum_brightwellii.AAC.1